MCSTKKGETRNAKFLGRTRVFGGSLAAVCALALLLQPKDLSAQVVSDCINEVASGTTVTPLVAHVGDTITINLVNAGTSAGDCDLANVNAWLVKPDNSSQLVFTDGVIPAGSCFQCPPNAAVCLGTGTCQGGVSFTYVVNAADIGDGLSFTTPGGSSQTLPGIPNNVQFMPVAEGVVPPGGNASGLTAAGRGQAKVLIINPAISVTKQCVTNCPPYSSPYGSAINFSGTVCNTGDTTLTGVGVTDVPAASITFATTTSSGNPFPSGGNGTLTNGECVTYTGSYTPTGTGTELCGPFTDTIVASGSDSTLLTVSATNTATCLVCTTPCIEVTKNCPATVAFGSTSYPVDGIVTNCGNVPLTGVVVTDNNGTPGNTATTPRSTWVIWRLARARPGTRLSVCRQVSAGALLIRRV